MIKNCPIATSDIERMTKIWGKDIAVLKGKTVRRTPRKIPTEIFEIPKELYENCSKVQLHMDTFYICQMAFLATIGHPMYYRTCVSMNDSEANTLYKSLDKTLRTYNYGGFKINKIECDGEFKAIMDNVKDKLNIKNELYKRKGSCTSGRTK